MNTTNHYHIAKMVRLFESEDQPFRKVHRMIDLFETIIKTHTAVIVSDYFHGKKISDRAKGMFVEGLRVPSLGIWQMFSRETMKELTTRGESKEKEGLDLFIQGFDRYFKNWAKPVDAKIIAFRNSYAHGATPSDEECQRDIEELTPVLETMLEAEWLNNTTVVVFKRNNNKLSFEDLEGFSSPFFEGIKFSEILNLIVEKNGIPPAEHPFLLLRDNRILDLFPLMAYRGEEGGDKDYLVFFNDLKRKGEVGLLSYPESLHLRDGRLYDEFISRIPLDEWKKSGKTDEFKDRIAELTEVFKGRSAEMEVITDFVEKREKGMLFVFGPPGIGKSALVAKALSDRGIHYYIRRGTIYSDPSWFLNYLHDELDRVVRTGIEKGATQEEKGENLHRKLSAVGEALAVEEKSLVLLIDGLDEGIERGILRVLPAGSYSGIFLVYSSRPVEEVISLFDSLSPEEKERVDLTGLGEEEIRAILYDSANKYALTREYIKAVTERSGGNPLYMKMLCYALETGEIDINDPAALPEGVTEFYRGFIRRFSSSSQGETLTILYLFAAAEDYLSPGWIYEILGQETVGMAALERGILALSEVLLESSHEEGKYQLFHESFRDFLRKNKTEMVSALEEKLIQWCSRWKDSESSANNKEFYIARHYSTHLRRLHRKDELLTLLREGEFLSFQKRVTRQFDEGFLFFRNILQCLDVSFQEAVETAAAAGRHHLFLLNSFDEVSALVLKEGRIEEAVGMAKLFPKSEGFFLLLDILYHSLFSKIPGITERPEKIRNIAENLLQLLRESAEDGWREKVGLSIIWVIAKKLEEMGIDPGILFELKEQSEDDDISALFGELGTIIPVEVEADLFIEKVNLEDPNELELLLRLNEPSLTAAAAEKILLLKGPGAASEFAASRLNEGSEEMSRTMLSICRAFLKEEDNEGAASVAGYLLGNEWITAVLEIAAFEHAAGKEKDCEGSWSVIIPQGEERLANEGLADWLVRSAGELIRQDREEKALALYNDLTNAENRAEAALVMTRAYADLGESEKAQEILKNSLKVYRTEVDRERAAMEIRRWVRAALDCGFNFLAEEWNKTQAEEAKGLSNAIYRDETLKFCSIYTAELGNPEDALKQVFSEIFSPGEKTDAFRNILYQNRNTIRADHLERLIVTLPRKEQRDSFYSFGGTCFLAAGKKEEGERFFRKACNPRLAAEDCVQVGKILSEGEQFPEASDLYGEALKIFEGDALLIRDSDLRIALAEGFFRLGEKEKAREIAEEFFFHLPETPYERVRGLKRISNLLFFLNKTGRMEKTLRAALIKREHLPLEDIWFIRTTLSNYGVSLVERGEMASLFELLTLSPLVYSFQTVINALFISGKTEEALQVAGMAAERFRTGKESGNPRDNSGFLRQLASILTRWGRKDEALRYFEASVETALSSPSGEDRFDGLRQTALNLIYLGEEEKAADLAKRCLSALDQINDQYLRRTFVEETAEVLIGTGQYREAQDLLNRELDPQERARVLLDKGITLLLEKPSQKKIEDIKELVGIADAVLPAEERETSEVRLYYAGAYGKIGLMEEAKTELSRLTGSYEEGPAAVNLAKAFVSGNNQIKNPGEAEDLLSRVETPENGSLLFEEFQNTLFLIAAEYSRTRTLEDTKRVFLKTDPDYFPGEDPELDSASGELFRFLAKNNPRILIDRIEESENPLTIGFIALSLIPVTPNIPPGELKQGDQPVVTREFLEDLAWRAVSFVKGDMDIVTKADGSTEKMRLLRPLLEEVSTPERVISEMEHLIHSEEKVEVFYTLTRKMERTSFTPEIMKLLLNLEDRLLNLHIASCMPDYTETFLQSVCSQGLYSRDILAKCLYSAAVYIKFAAPVERKKAFDTQSLLTSISSAVDVSGWAEAVEILSEKQNYDINQMKNWIDSVEDEDDRDQIELWVRRVKKDKLSEEEFSRRVEDLLK